MFCKNCGKETNDSASFCPYCGTTLSPVTPVSKPENTIPVGMANSAPVSDVLPVYKRKSKAALFVAFIPLIVVTLRFIMMYLLLVMGL